MKAQTERKKNVIFVRVFHFNVRSDLDVVEVDSDVILGAVSLHGQIDRSFVDSCVLGQFPVLLQVTRLVRVVTMYDVYLFLIQKIIAEGSNDRMSKNIETFGEAQG